MLFVHVSGARELKSTSTFGSQSPYCKLVVAGKKQKTEPDKGGGRNPQWRNDFDIFVPRTLAGQFLFVEVKVKKSFGNESLGTGKVKATSVPNFNTNVSIPIYDTSGRQCGVVETIMRFEDRGGHMGPSSAPAQAMPVAAVPVARGAPSQIPTAGVQRQRSLQQLGHGLASAAMNSDGLLDLRRPSQPSQNLLDLRNPRSAPRPPAPAAPAGTPPHIPVYSYQATAPATPSSAPVFVAPEAQAQAAAMARSYSNSSAYSNSSRYSTDGEADGGPTGDNAVNAVHEANVKELQDMGFDRASAEAALRQSNDVVRVAVNILLGEGPSSPPPRAAPPPRSTTAAVYTYNSNPYADVVPMVPHITNAVPVEVPARAPVRESRHGSTGGRALKSGWEERKDAKSGRFYYVNHSTKSTSWQHPGWAW
ncbi:hypothetical protein TrRE_jg5463 [Triparma retinervis]|uniref:Uncharacterized protein n=1 Tax=Triparma retinervis TaxID=2557542 RepID=A0A9W7CKG0_9STRA|nr:hypothetical protein TrRE_jg5463 [Triparma retinervis]